MDFELLLIQLPFYTHSVPFYTKDLQSIYLR